MNGRQDVVGRINQVCSLDFYGAKVLLLCSHMCVHAFQIFKELAKASGPIGSGSAPDRSRSDDQAWRVAKFAGRMAAETAAGFALWELFNIITN